MRPAECRSTAVRVTLTVALFAALLFSFRPAEPAAPLRHALAGFSAGAAGAPDAAPAARACTAAEHAAQAHAFANAPGRDIYATGCPPRAWLWPALAAAGLRCRPLTLVIVGANKGYSIAALADLVRPGLGVHPRALLDFLTDPGRAAKQLLHDPCGFCDDCRDGPLAPAAPPPGAPACAPGDFAAAIHAFEPTTSNHGLLDYGVAALVGEAVARAGGAAAAGLSLALYAQAVVGDANTTWVDFGRCQAGVERCGVADAARGFLPATQGDGAAIATERVRAVTLDAWAAAEGVESIDVLITDTEGMDPEALRGAAGLLARGAVRLLEFEYHAQRAWLGTTLERVVAQLDEWGYDCAFEGAANATRLTKCWAPVFEVRRWSNVVCASRREPALLAVLAARTALRAY